MNNDKTPLTGDKAEDTGSKMSENKRTTVISAMQQSSYSGPLPAPEDFARYDAVLPGAAERILKMAEENSVHRQQMEKRIIYSGTRQSCVGQILGFILILVFGAIAAFLGYCGHDALAGTIACTTILGLACVFVLGKKPANDGKM